VSDFTIILRSLRARLFSTVVTVLTVAVAVALILVLLTMRDSGKRAFERGAGDMHLMVAGDESPLVAILNSVFYTNPPRRPITWERYSRLTSQAPWAYTVPTAIGDSFRGYPVVATSRDMFDKFRPVLNAQGEGEAWKLREGRYFSSDFEVVLGAQVARATGIGVGDTIFFTHGFPKGAGTVLSDHIRKGAKIDHRGDHDESYHAGHDHESEGSVDGAGHVHREFGCEVVGILEPTFTPHDRAIFSNLETTWIVHAHDRIEREAAAKGLPEPARTTREQLIESDRLITAAYLRLISREGSGTPTNLPQVFDALRREGGITVAQPKQEIDRLFVIVDNTNRLFLAIAFVVMLSSAVGIMLALYNSMEQRRRQIAVFRVLGASAGRIFNLIVTESAIIGVLGAVLGALLGYGGAWAARGVLRDRLGVIIEPAIAPSIVLYLVVVTIVLACIAGLVPAFMAYRTSVARNLRPVA
jgi:putative ABC transport system permease protein